MIDNLEQPISHVETERPATALDLEADGMAGRRTFLGWFLGIGTVSIAGLLSIPLVRFALDPLTRTSTETEWADLGPTGDFSETSAPQKRTVSITQTDGWRKVV